MLNQASFDFTAPAPDPGEVEVMIAYLKTHPGFHTRRELCAALAYTDRKVRQLAEDSDGLIVSGPGSPGYCHFDHCPVELAARTNEALISQGKRMIKRGLRGKRRVHARFR